VSFHANIEKIAVMVGVVPDVPPCFTRLHDFPFGHGLIGGNVTRLAVCGLPEMSN